MIQFNAVDNVMHQLPAVVQIRPIHRVILKTCTHSMDAVCDAKDTADMQLRTSDYIH